MLQYKYVSLAACPIHVDIRIHTSAVIGILL